MLIEFCQYRCQDGRREEFVRFMEEEVIPYQRSCGMEILGTFIDKDDPTLFCWMRRFEREDDVPALYEKSYGSDRWKAEFADRLDEYIRPWTEAEESQPLVPSRLRTLLRLEPTEASALR
jgi:hypothetical protein